MSILSGGHKLLVCNKCGHTHIAVTRQYAESIIAFSKGLYKTAGFSVIKMPEVSDYEKCANCGADRKEMRAHKEGDLPALSSMIIED